MDLISREAAIEAVKIPDDGCSNQSERYGIIFARVEARKAIRNLPTVPAVPLDKLCEWLERNAAGRWNGLEYTASGWKDELTTWMEEQDADRE